MLSEEIKRYNNFGSKDGLFFIYQHIKDGALSVSSLKRFVVHNPGHIEVEVDATIMLFQFLGIVDYDLTSDTITLKDASFSSVDAFMTHLTGKSIDLVFKEGILNLDTISYDTQQDRFCILKKCIQMKYACFRNLLLTLGVFENRTPTTYFFSSTFSKVAQLHIKKKKIISQEELLKKQQEQTEQGEAGEIFVMQYEKNRLSGHKYINKIKQISIVDVSAGYDIVSFNELTSTVLDRFIEVKTYIGKPHFHWSSNEMDIAKLRGIHYYLYLVSFENIHKDGYEPIIIQDPINYFENHIEWHFSVDGVTVTKQ